jgi:hypothetical protein
VSTPQRDPFADLWEEANKDDTPPPASGTTVDENVVDESVVDLPLTPPLEDEVQPDDADLVSPAAAEDRVDDKTGIDRSSKASATERETIPIKARQVYRLVRRVDPWSVLRVSFLFYLSTWLISVLAGLILYQGASSSGMIEKIEKFIVELFGLEAFRFNGGQMLQAAVIGGLIAVVVGSAFTALLSVLFNLIADLTGGIRLTVVEVARAHAPSGASGTNSRRVRRNRSEH